MTRRAMLPGVLALVGSLLVVPALLPVAAQARPGAALANLARLDHGLKARALAEGVHVVEGANAGPSRCMANSCAR